MRLVFTPNGWDDYTHWLQADRQVLERINRLIDEAQRDPTTGIGKPEPQRHLFAGAWSRRITDEHRLVYLVDGEDLVILQVRVHYKKPDALLVSWRHTFPPRGSQRSGRAVKPATPLVPVDRDMDRTRFGGHR